MIKKQQMEFSTMKRTITPILFCMMLLWSLLTHSANIIFDLGDVLIETKYLQSVLHIGPIKMASYALTLQNPFAIHTKLYEFLDTIKPHQPGDLVITDHHGNAMPALMNDWLAGIISGPNLITIIENNINSIESWPTRTLILSLARTIFNPESFAQTRYIVPEGAEFVNTCKKAGHKVYILSNWDPISFTYMQQMHPEFFNCFDGIIISGDVHLLKPDHAIYHYFLQRFNLEPHDCIFIDDLEANVIVAREFGIPSIHYVKKQGLLFKKPNFEAVEKQMDELLLSNNTPIAI
jgi:hypothetical protein